MPKLFGPGSVIRPKAPTSQVSGSDRQELVVFVQAFFETPQISATPCAKKGVPQLSETLLVAGKENPASIPERSVRHEPFLFAVTPSVLPFTSFCSITRTLTLLQAHAASPTPPTLALQGAIRRSAPAKTLLPAHQAVRSHP
jgi:hypothetical protein